MIRVIVEIWPFGDESKKETIAIANIANDGTGTNNTGNYTFSMSKCGRGKEDADSKFLNRTWKQGKLLNFKRARYNAWYLVASCLNEALKKQDQQNQLNQEETT